MEAWSNKARRLIPDLQVIGNLRDAPGFLVIINVVPTALSMKKIEGSLMVLGATGWHWEPCRHKVKMRVYTTRPSRSRYPARLMVTAALTGLALCWHYDIHDLSSVTRLWSR